MQKDQRLRKAQDFAHVFRLGRAWADDLLVLRAMPNGMEERGRFGFSVGKRTGNAVVRNTIKRRIREAVRRTPVKGGWDIVFVARRGAALGDYHQLEASVRKLLRRADLLAAVTQMGETKA